MRLVEQTTWNDCGAACLATVTGDSLRTVKRAVDVPTTHGAMEQYLREHPIAHQLVTVRGEPTVRELSRQHRPFAEQKPFERRTLILSVASPAATIDWHALVVHRGRVLDPQRVFTTERLFDSHCLWATEVSPTVRERPTQARPARPPGSHVPTPP